MTFEVEETDLRLPKGLINHSSSKIIMDRRMRSSTTATAAATPMVDEVKRRDHQGSFSQANVKKPFKVSYFSIESLLLLICLTASLLILPLILPPLPPPPFMLLLLPIGILALLMILAFMPCNVRDLTYTYM
ncbi:hypothetical protein Ancab_008542 [Ancistrocladus abbreviatus]